MVNTKGVGTFWPIRQTAVNALRMKLLFERRLIRKDNMNKTED